MAEKRFIDANGSYTLIATDNTQYGLCFGGGIISVINWHGSVVAEFYADDAPAADVVPREEVGRMLGDFQISIRADAKVGMSAGEILMHINNMLVELKKKYTEGE